MHPSLPLSLQCLALSAWVASILSSSAASAPSTDSLRRPISGSGRSRRRINVNATHREDYPRRKLKREDLEWEKQQRTGAPSCPSTLSRSVDIGDDGATLHYALVPSSPAGSNNGLLCGRIEASVDEDDGWVAFGVSRDGGMIGSQAVIGVPREGTALKYDMYEQWLSQVVRMPPERQTLSDASVYYDGDEGRTIMEFAKPLVEEGEVPILEEGVNIFLYARGGRELGLHHAEEAFEMNFGEDDEEDGLDFVEDAEVRVPTEMPTTDVLLETKCCDPKAGPGGCPDENGSFDNCWDEGGYCCGDGNWYADPGDGSGSCRDKQLEDSAACMALEPASGGCLVGDILYSEGDDAGHIGLECINGTTYGGLESTCGPDGTVVEAERTFTCPESNPHCVQCGPRGRSNALCLSTPTAAGDCGGDDNNFGTDPIVCPDGQDPIPETFCGRGPSHVDCGNDEYCFVHPADEFAVCCPGNVEEQPLSAKDNSTSTSSPTLAVSSESLTSAPMPMPDIAPARSEGPTSTPSASSPYPLSSSKMVCATILNFLIATTLVVLFTL